MSKAFKAAILVALLTKFSASVKVLSKIVPTTGSLDQIIDGDVDATGSCVTMTGVKPYFTIDYESVIRINTILLIAPINDTDWPFGSV